MTVDESRWDAIVVGAGLGGLSSAAYLAAAGQRTLLLERYKVLGGFSHVFRRQGKWEFDIGLHYIGDCGPDGLTSRVLRGLALEERINFRRLDRDGYDIVLGPDFELKIPQDWDAYLDNLIAAFPKEERALRRYISIVRRLGSGVDRSRASASLRGEFGAWRHAGAAAAWRYVPHGALLTACGLSPRAIQVLSQYAGAYASAPTAAPSGLHAGFMDTFISGGAWYPEGGAQSLAANFADVILTHGGEIRTGASVAEIRIEGGQVCGVRLEDGEILHAPVVVSDIDIKKTYLDLVGRDHLPWRLARRVNRWKMATPYLGTYFGLELDLRQQRNANYYVIPSWEDATSVRNLSRIIPDLATDAQRRVPEEWARDHAARMPGMVFSGTTRDPGNSRSAPPGWGAVEVLSIVPPVGPVWGIEPEELADGSYSRSGRYQELKEILIEGMLDRVERVYPGVRPLVRFREAATAATHYRYTGTQSAAGLQLRPSQFGMFRPRSATPIRGLFLAGASTAWGPGTLGAMLSGMHAAGAILGRDLDAEIQAGLVLADRGRLGAYRDADPLRASRGFGRAVTESASGIR
ncbi:phytoene desaturase family protein [Nocardia pseudobrasiliensis]|uniref:Phytoene dehydrogenase-like protein n=1 Tax=Nocardia pseudobrasiliensis TaxID=45979 RepID=A0A370I5Z3_9NOCA|nr:NAD(P)/FAD-dependent oxidoreductase [Nocardia pseudobrasiliensis]RDI66155.1 phytoene dehydrogenase-like protein [Nocardia pseudobrasiliensis]